MRVNKSVNYFFNSSILDGGYKQWEMWKSMWGETNILMTGHIELQCREKRKVCETDRRVIKTWPKTEITLEEMNK